MSDSVSPVGDGETLLRTDFSPMHIQDGQLLPAAIRSDDLAQRGFSVDREHLVGPDTLEARASVQMARDTEQRKEAWISPFSCGLVRADIFPMDGSSAFRVEHEPVESNEAHAAIYSAQPRSKSEIKVLKTLLLPHLNAGLKTLASYTAECAAAASLASE
ncbi:hypothetical protein [Sphingobium sp. CFD-1]|uniref:hypothetical protein n=1 Tax=Sphingobium sp. CFD-1 TaxID=2878545 RepID=UPI00214AF1DD|nr:hypothetical protein [Sphingobium sp. CFD-1]